MIEVHPGTGPIVLGLPHTGTDVPNHVWAAFNEGSRMLADTDWHVHDLYDGLLDGVTTVRTRIHRYVIDVNRAPDGHSLYPGQATTGLCPLTDFDGRPIYPADMAPDEAEVAERLLTYHAPYHAALSAELTRVRDLHGCAILYDCHSIRSVIPNLFDGRLPDFNIGTNGTTSCAPVIEQVTADICRTAAGYSTVVNGRFIGGWTTRHYGRPADGIHAIQMELAQSTYMREAPPWTYNIGEADRLRTSLRRILEALKQTVETGALS